MKLSKAYKARAILQMGSKLMWHSLHPFRATCPVAVVKVDPFALQNEGPDAILRAMSV